MSRHHAIISTAFHFLCLINHVPSCHMLCIGPGPYPRRFSRSTSSSSFKFDAETPKSSRPQSPRHHAEPVELQNMKKSQ